MALLRTLLIFVSSLTLYVLYRVRQSVLRDPRRRYVTTLAWTQAWAKCVCRIAGLRVVRRGPHPPAGSLIAPNHLGYADILALACVARCFFVSRADAADWPLLGRLVRHSEQILVSRKRSRDLSATAGQIEQRLRSGQSVCVFLEGTTTGGDRILPFLPALLQPALNCGAPAVPTAIRWTSSNPELDISEDLAYWKDHSFPSHFWRLMGLRGARAEIRFGHPLPPDPDRKRFAVVLREQVMDLWNAQPPS